MSDNESSFYTVSMSPGANPLPVPVEKSLDRKFNGEGSAYRALDNKLYVFQGVSDSSGPSNLYKIDVETGKIDLVKEELLDGAVDGAEFYYDVASKKEIFYVLSGESHSKIYAFDSTTWVLLDGYPKTVSGDTTGISSIAIDPVSGDAYGIDDYNYDNKKPKLYNIDLATGKTTFKVQLDQIADAEGLAYASDGNLYIEDERYIDGRKIYKVDLVNGSLLPAAVLGGHGDIEGLSCNGTEITEEKMLVVAEYHFDKCTWDGTNGEVTDTQGEHNATAKNAATTYHNGQIKRAAHFTGNNYIDAGDTFNDIFGDQNNKFTITAWVKPSVLTNAKTNHNTKNTFIAKASDAKNDNLEIGVNPDGSLHIYLDTKGKDKYADIGSGITKDSWHFIAVSYDGNNTKVKIDGNSFEDNSTWKNGGNIDNAGGSPFTIGASLHVDNFFQGDIDEFKIYDGVLSDAKLQVIYEEEKTDNGDNRDTQTCLMGEYRFDACDWFAAGSKVKDSTGNNDALAEDIYSSKDAVIERSAKFDDAIVETDPDYSFKNKPFALSFWLKVTKLPDAPFMAVLGKDLEVYIRKSGKLSINPKNGSSDLISNDAIKANEWRYITLSSDGKEVTLYIDGKENGTLDAKDLGKNGNSSLMLGKTAWSEGASNTEVENLMGYIDEVKVFDDQLDATKIKQLIALDNAGKNYDGSNREKLLCLTPVGCTDKAIVIDDTKFVHQIDLVTGDKNTTVMTNEQVNKSSVNGFGYNIKDGFFWGSNQGAGGYLVKIGKDENGEFSQKKVGPIEGLPTSKGTYIGDIDHNGKLYLFYKNIPTSSEHTMFIVNLDQETPNYLKVVDSFKLKNIAVADMSFNPIDKQLYAIESDNDLYKIDVHHKTVTLVKSQAVDAQKDTFGSSFFDAQGFFYAIKNNSRKIYRIDISDPQKIRSLIFSTLVNEDVKNVNIDGGRCNLKPIYIDYGDAPDSSSYSTGDGTDTLNYKTLTSDNGARHRLPSDENATNVYLGNSVSSESDAKSSSTDYNYDDDNGIVDGIKPLYTNMYTYTLKVKVTNDTNLSANLVGWIDFNRNGRFEKKEGLSAVVNQENTKVVTLTWNVPNDVEAGITYARFRVTTDALSIEESDSYGPKRDGEVEDWQIEIKEGTLYDVWDVDSNNIDRVIKTKIVNKLFNLTVASIGRNGNLKQSTGTDIQVRIVSKDDGSVLSAYQDVNLSVMNMVSIPVSEISKATKEARVQIRYIDELNITREVNATDLFAIRPDHFTIKTSESSFTAGEDFNITLHALDPDNSVVTTFSQNKDNYLLDINETKQVAACDLEIEAEKEKKDFISGQSKITVKYSDIGKLEIWLREKAGSEFANIDAADTPDKDRYIKESKRAYAINPENIELIWSLKNGDEINQVTYFNSYDPNDTDYATMSAKLNLQVLVKNKDGNTVKNFTDGCYAKDVKVAMHYKIQSDDNTVYKTMISYQDRNNTYYSSPSTLPDTMHKGEATINNFKLEASLFKNGQGIKKVKFNFERDASIPFNPMLFTIKDINASLNSSLNVSDDSDQNLKFLYARAHIPDQDIVGEKGDAKVFYEVYCKDCDRTVYGLGGLAESVDSVNWYILKTLNETYTDFTIPPSLNGFTSGNGITANYNSYLSALQRADYNQLHIETKKSPATVRIKYEPKKYLIFNPFNSTAKFHGFTANFVPKAHSWAGKGKVGATIDTTIAPRNNMNIIDW